LAFKIIVYKIIPSNSHYADQSKGVFLGEGAGTCPPYTTHVTTMLHVWDVFPIH